MFPDDPTSPQLERLAFVIGQVWQGSLRHLWLAHASLRRLVLEGKRRKHERALFALRHAPADLLQEPVRPALEAVEYTCRGPEESTRTARPM